MKILIKIISHYYDVNHLIYYKINLKTSSTHKQTKPLTLHLKYTIIIIICFHKMLSSTIPAIYTGNSSQRAYTLTFSERLKLPVPQTIQPPHKLFKIFLFSSTWTIQVNWSLSPTLDCDWLCTLYNKKGYTGFSYVYITHP